MWQLKVRAWGVGSVNIALFFDLFKSVINELNIIHQLLCNR